jgi:hypothetical protein
MAMRETVRSLKLYFILSALLSGAMNVRALLGGEGGVGAILAVLGIAFAAAYLYVGLNLRRLLATAPGRIANLLIAGAVFLVLLLLLGLMSGTAGGALPFVTIGLLITWYLFVNVRRLAAESHRDAAAVAGGTTGA